MTDLIKKNKLNIFRHWRAGVVFLLNVVFFISVPSCSYAKLDFNPEKLIHIAEEIDRAGDMAYAERYLSVKLQSANLSSGTKNEVKSYLKKIKERVNSADKPLDEIKMKIDMKHYPRMNFKYHFQLGWAYDAVGKKDLAISHYTQSLKFKPENTWPRVKRGLLRERLGQFKAAQLDLERAYKYEKRDPISTFQLALFYARNGLPKKARKLASDLRQKWPRYTQVVKRLLADGEIITWKSDNGVSL